LKGDDQEIKLSVTSFFWSMVTPAIDHNSILSFAPF
jgi:hypothetical protein